MRAFSAAEGGDVVVSVGPFVNLQFHGTGARSDADGVGGVRSILMRGRNIEFRAD